MINFLSYKAFELDDDLDSLDLLDDILRKKRPSVVHLNYTKEIPMFVIYETEWLPIGTKILFENKYHPTELIALLPDDSIKRIKISD